jgi:hypothetical protein
MKSSLDQIAPSSQANSLPEAPSGQPRLSVHSQPGGTAGSKRSAAGAGLDALPQRASPDSLAAEGSTGQAHKRPRLSLDELSRRTARPCAGNALTLPARPVSLASSGVTSETPVARLSGRRFHAHESETSGTALPGRRADAHESETPGASVLDQRFETPESDAPESETPGASGPDQHFDMHASEMPATSLPKRHFDAHASHHLPDILRRLETLHHDYGAHLTPEAVDQLRHEIRQLHDIAKLVLDIKRRLMRRLK